MTANAVSAAELFRAPSKELKTQLWLETFLVFTLPTLALAFVIASIIGLAFYLVFGHGWLRLVVYWLVAVFGFFVGQILGALFQFSLLPIGSVNLLEGTIACLIALFVTRAVWKNPAA
ncbi:hypothetical protein FBQ82_09905 [Anaerolineae bacterium CFX7]|nr:hypothetical protein [Anaerolineae bacterium CFX7]